jgi:hypothetical protein
MANPFFIVGLPRSRTAWFAEYFTAMGHKCHHEFLKHCKSRDDFYNEMGKGVGDSDCMLSLTNFQEKFPSAPTLIVHRPIGSIMKSAEKLGIDASKDLLVILNSINKNLLGLHVDFSDIDSKLREISYFLVGDFHQEVANKFIGTNIQNPITGSVESVNIWRN